MKNRLIARIHTLLLSYRKTECWRKKEVARYLASHKVAKLQVGCGIYRLEGWLNTDLVTNYRTGNPIYLDVGKPFPMPDSSFDYVYSEHTVEHLTYPQATNILKECFRIMKPGGIIRIATPNLQFLADLYLHPKKEINKAYIEFNTERSGLPADPGLHHQLLPHHLGASDYL